MTDQSFSQFLRDVSHDIRKLSRHRLYPLMMILDDLRNEKGNAFSELFKVIIVSQKTEEHQDLLSFGIGKKGVAVDIDGLKYESIGLGCLPTGRFDLALAIVETSTGCVASFHYNASIYQETTIQRLAHNYLNLLQNIVSDPHKNLADIGIISDEEKLQLDIWNRTALDPKEKSDFIKQFEKRVRATPKAPAIVF